MKIAHVLAGSPMPDVANGVRKYVYFMAKAQAELARTVVVSEFQWSASARTLAEAYARHANGAIPSKRSR